VSAAAALRPRELDDQLAAVAGDTKRPAAVRLEALRAVLPRRPQLDAATFKLLSSRLAPQSPPLERLAAASLVGTARLDEAQALAVVERVGADAIVSPSAVLPALANAPGERLRRPLVAYLKASLARGWEPAEGQLDPLLSKLPAGADADALRAAAAGVAKRRRSRLAEFEPLLAGGNAERGRLVFFGNQVACGTCHRVGDQGGRVGPDLTKVGAIRAGRDILESIVLPSSTIAQGYDHYVVQTKTGEVHAGVVPQPSADVLELRDAAGQVTRLHKDDVARLKRQPISLMPDGLPAAMTREEFADLLAFLQGLR
jgi:putative heme-binding domain-containing protein